MGDNNGEDLKMILLGNCGVGKTNIISRYLKDEFCEYEMSSHGANYAMKPIIINDKKYNLNIWDTAGQERFHSVTKMFVQDSQIIVLCYSITDKKSFKDLDFWLKMADDIVGENNYILGIVANKSDLYIDEKVKDSEGIKYASEHNGIFKLISAKEGKTQIDILFEELFTKYENSQNGSNQKGRRQSLKIKKSKEKKIKCCK